MDGVTLNQLVIILVSILLSMTLHEAMHAFASHWLGDTTAKDQGRLTLNPLAHIDPLLTVGLPLLLAITGGPIFGAAKPVPFDPSRLRYEAFGMAIVGAAGPLTNLVLAFLAYVVYVLSSGAGEAFWVTFIYVNLGFFVFNMLPIPPLDGSRVLYAVAPDGVREMMETIEQYSLFIVFAIIILFNQQLGQFMFAAISSILGLFRAVVG